MPGTVRSRGACVQHPEPEDVTDQMIELSERPIHGVIDGGSAIRAAPQQDRVVANAFDAHAERLTSFAIAAVRDRDVADDMVAETYLRLIQEVRAGRVPDNIGGWLHRVCANLITSRGRRLTVARRALGRLLDRGVADSPETQVVRRDLNERTVQALGQLPEDARIALLLAAEGYDMTTIGLALGRSPNATRTFVCRSRVRLRDILAVDEPGGAGR